MWGRGGQSAEVWTYRTSAHYALAERAALDFAVGVAAQPSAVTDDLFVATPRVVAIFGSLNRWNDSLATPLEATPLAVAQKAAGGEHTWSPGKHGSPVDLKQRHFRRMLLTKRL